MAYESSKMRLMGGVPGQQLFLYRSEDDAAQVAASGYLDQAVEEYHLCDGDIVIAVTGEAGSRVIGLYATRLAGSAVSLTAAA